MLPNIKRNGHHGVEDDDVGPEGKESRETSGVSIFPWQEDGEVGAFVYLPDVVSYRQDHAHADEKTKNLKGNTKTKDFTNQCQGD